MPPYRICFVCMGNICRSPTAEVVMRARLAEAGLAEQVIVDSAGTTAWHVGSAIDERSAQAMRAHGYDADSHVAQQFDPAWFASRDLLVAMDGKNLQSLRWLASPEDVQKIVRLRSFDAASQGGDLDVPDPYYGGPGGFEEVLAMIEAACTGLVSYVRGVLAS